MILDYKDIDIYQDEHLVLKGVNLHVDEGEMVYLTGQVGSGKSSLLKSIYGEIPVEGESAKVLGFNMNLLKTRQQPALRQMPKSISTRNIMELRQSLSRICL